MADLDQCVSMDQSEDGTQLTNQSETSLFSSKGDDSDTGDEENETYYFESDHVALKGNPDYHAMLQVIAILEAQRIQVKLFSGVPLASESQESFSQSLGWL